MAPSTPAPDAFALESQIRELFGRVVYSHKAHEKCADAYLRKLGQIKFWQISLSAVTTGSLLLAVFGDGKASTVIGAILSTLLFGLTAYTKDYDFGELTQKHVDTANKLWVVRESYLSLLTDLSTEHVNLLEAREQRDALQNTLAAIYQSAPRTTPEAYSASQKALKINEELTFSDEEIDMFLPAPLRRGKPKTS
jgi:hypothetical protein